MTDAAEVEALLLGVCERHYVNSRRLPTALAVPVGTVDRLSKGVYRFIAPGQLVVASLGIRVALEELDSLTSPTVLSDRARI